MKASYTADERRRLALDAAAPEPLACPACGGTVVRRPVQAPPGVAYVRRRIWIHCPACGRSASIDLKADGRP